MHHIITENLPQIIPLLQQDGVSRAYVFGSAVDAAIKDGSDIDFLISFKVGIEPLERGGHWWELHDSLRELLNREIDLVVEENLTNPYLIASIRASRCLIHGQP